MNFASNFLIGDVPKLSADIDSDFRFNYFNNCSELCCLLNANCVPDCLVEARDFAEPLPHGVKSSVWTELNVTLLGIKKRIIQIETHFSAVPHMMNSFACPNISALDSCNDDPRMVYQSFDEIGGIELEMNTPFLGSQSPDTYQTFLYRIKGNICTTNVKVNILNYSHNFFC